ncbi:MAG: ECF transporter S component [Firmicutes bacterium]|nr:ECF transporter S component [Bacillota bacterium]
MTMINKFFIRFTTFDFVIIALLSACGIATKPFVRFLAEIFTGTLVPIGTVAGIFYMLWIVLACAIVKKRGTAILVGIVQSVLVVVFDMLGNRGLANLLVYVVPGITLELAMLAFPHYVSTLFSSFTAGAVCNATGSFIVSVVFMRLAFIPMLVSLIVSVIFGGIGGIVGYKLYDVVNNLKGAQGNTANEKPQD